MKKICSLIFVALCIPILAGCSGDGKIHVNFEPVINLKTNTIKEQVYDEAHKVKKPTVVIIDENPDSLELYGWYTTKDFTTKWNFSKDIATQSMTLYGRFVSQYEVNYYQGIDETNLGLLATELVFKNDPIPNRDDLPDCYENPETCYLNNVQVSESGVISGTKGKAVDFNSDIVDSPKSVFFRRSKNCYFSPDAINRRFTPVASSMGSYGSTVGSITVMTEESTNEKYAHVDFGEASKNDPAIDPYIIIDNPQVDVTSSQYLEITMRNPGYGDTLAFYWVGKWKVNGKWINGKEYHSFAEDRAFKFKAGTGTDTDSIIYKDASQQKLRYLYNSNEWRTYLIPISNKMSNGVSVWGCAGVITALRIQSSFPNSNPDGKRTNVIDIKSIRGVKSDKEYNFDDSATVESLKMNDTETDLKNASDKQSDINGLIFPKNRQFVTPTDEKTTVYNHVNGVAMYGTYVNEKASIEMNFPAEKEVDLDKYTTFNFKYCNHSYVSKITFIFRVRITSGAAKGRELNVAQQFDCSTLMKSMEEAKINMFGVDSYEGHLIKLTVSFNTIGVDNLIEFQEFRFSDYEARSLIGVNFYDLHCGGFIGEAGIDVSYNNNKHATKFDVTNESSKAINDSISYDLICFESFTLIYNFESGSSITQIKISMKLKDKADSVLYTIDVEQKAGDHSEIVNIQNHDAIEGMSISFTGTGTIYLKSLKLNYFEDTLNFTTGEYLTYKNCSINDAKDYAFDKNELALFTNANSKFIYGRLGSRFVSDGMRINGEYIYNMSLKGKKSIVITYQNRSEATSFNLGFGALRKTEYLEEEKYLTKDVTINNLVSIEGENPKAGGQTTIRDLSSKMAAGEWATYVFPIDEYFTRSTKIDPSTGYEIDIECYLATFYFATNANMNGKSFYIRNFTLI